jgi:transcription initiation factor TFIID subunit TAF12
MVVEMRHFQERQTYLQQNKERAGRRWRISRTTSSVRLASAFMLLGATSILKSL